VHGHPKGTIAGAKAMRQAMDAVMKNKSLKEYSKTHLELKEALNKWGE
jgi:ribulose-bisphosphate carboxylase large chain